MIKPIGFDKGIGSVSPPKTPARTKSSAQFSQDDGVKVSNQLGHLIHLLSPQDMPVDETQRVMAMKYRVDANAYTVDLDALSAKLMTNGMMKGVGNE